MLARPLTANDRRNLQRLARTEEMNSERKVIEYMLERGLIKWNKKQFPIENANKNKRFKSVTC